ncbi:arginine N-succinyltransferase [Sphingomonas sp. BN140010]|uniref:Arginine N-succinyltransferase n=1 Tax=Sphingomonas arvum TaxID=2992113 RepID=A0ABT3JCM5_9SPHN|nr:arginine N-succinyltransferase [Sphingomonas sp. BN140010]MCW3796786.1 arginine N-succinyltransferase [Sphingomonas sp. BN140010]
MSFRVRPANPDDFDAIYEMAKLTGGGFTNLPADKGTLVSKLAKSEDAFDKVEEVQGNDCYIFVLEDPAARVIRGTCQVFGQVGVTQAFYSYHLSTLTQWSPELGKTFRNQMLTLTTDLEGSSEVGGLFLHPAMRAGGLGLLLARSRYLFIRQHRERFGDRLLAELRGVMDQAGNSPFWDALAGRFFDMSFPEADAFNAVNGTHFIAELMPKSPIYVSLLPDAARAVMGQPHPTGRAALRMLEGEGFAFDRYIDIFDGGPTVVSRTDQVRTVREAVAEKVVEVGDGGSMKMLLATGRLKSFRACLGEVRRIDNEGLALSADTAALLEVREGDTVLAVSR